METVKLDELIRECLKDKFSYIGEQEFKNHPSIKEYNCNECGSTISEEHIISHYINNHYYEGLRHLRSGYDGMVKTIKNQI